jgi:hypothetical protein
VITTLEKELLAVCLVHVAAKFEEIYFPNLSRYGKFAGCSRQMVAELEGRILRRLGFELLQPTAYDFLELNCQEMEMCKSEVKNMATMILDYMVAGKMHHKGS